MQRPIIEIDEEKCTGCGQCILDCAEGALAIIDGKARLVSEVFCDGLGACLNCPHGALSLVTREAPAFDEAAALAAKARRSGQPASCAGSAPRQLAPLRSLTPTEQGADPVASTATWPLQLRLVPPTAPFLRGAHLLLAAHCAGFCLPRLHEDWLAGRVPVIACPKLDDPAASRQALTALLTHGGIVAVTVLRMSVPCCGGLERLLHQAMDASGWQGAVSSRTVRLP